MTQTPNQLTPRMLAVALLSEKLADVRARIDAHENESSDQPLFHSRIIVFLEQTAEELRRAARYLETTDAADEDPGDP